MRGKSDSVQFFGAVLLVSMDENLKGERQQVTCVDSTKLGRSLRHLHFSYDFLLYIK